MTRRRMKNLNKALNEIGIAFYELEFRHWDKFFGGDGALTAKGFLYNLDEMPLTEEHLAKVLQIAKSKKTSCVILPELAAKKKGMVVCFLQLEFFQLLEDTSPSVGSALRQHFLYFQEDEKLLALDATLRELSEHMAFFRKEACNVALLPKASTQLRTAVKKAGKLMEQEGLVDQYMRNGMERSLAEALCKAVNCMNLIG